MRRPPTPQLLVLFSRARARAALTRRGERALRGVAHGSVGVGVRVHQRADQARVAVRHGLPVAARWAAHAPQNV